MLNQHIANFQIIWWNFVRIRVIFRFNLNLSGRPFVLLYFIQSPDGNVWSIVLQFCIPTEQLFSFFIQDLSLCVCLNIHKDLWWIHRLIYRSIHTQFPNRSKLVYPSACLVFLCSTYSSQIFQIFSDENWYAGRTPKDERYWKRLGSDQFLKHSLYKALFWTDVKRSDVVYLTDEGHLYIYTYI